VFNVKVLVAVLINKEDKINEKLVFEKPIFISIKTVDAEKEFTKICYTMKMFANTYPRTIVECSESENKYLTKLS
jgi:hypothetical protein